MKRGPNRLCDDLFFSGFQNVPSYKLAIFRCNKYQSEMSGDCSQPDLNTDGELTQTDDGRHHTGTHHHRADPLLQDPRQDGQAAGGEDPLREGVGEV